MNQEKQEIYFRLWENTDSVLESRSNFFLLAQSVFVIAFYTAPSLSKVYSIILSTFALLFALSWWQNTHRLTQRIDWVVKKQMLQIEEVKEFLTSARGIHGKWVVGLFLPAITTFFWLVIIVLTLLGV